MNDPVACTMCPMTSGVVIAAVFPNMLKRPPQRPAAFFGDASETTAQPSAPNPLPKNATHMMAMTAQEAVT